MYRYPQPFSTNKHMHTYIHTTYILPSPPAFPHHHIHIYKHTYIRACIHPSFPHHLPCPHTTDALRPPAQLQPKHRHGLPHCWLFQDPARGRRPEIVNLFFCIYTFFFVGFVLIVWMWSMAQQWIYKGKIMTASLIIWRWLFYVVPPPPFPPKGFWETTVTRKTGLRY